MPPMGWLMLMAGALASAGVANAYWPRRSPWTLVVSFLTAWLTTELAFHWLALILIVGGMGVAAGALDEVAGQVGLALLAASGAGLVLLGSQGRKTVVQLGGALADLDPEPAEPRLPRSHVVFPFLMNHRRGVRHERQIEFARAAGRILRLDVTIPTAAARGDRRPVILQIHGGGWTIGDKREQGAPLLNHMAAHGWVGVNANYRLSPGATFPDHLIDCKTALAWVRARIGDWGGDPDHVCVTGGSAGGHLAALLALTANDPRYQPGFADVDTTLRAAVPFYGIYDFTNRLGTWHPDVVRRFFGPWVIKAFLEEEPERFAEASPIDRIHAGAPPFLVVHGDRDTLAPVEDARLFVEKLRAASAQPVLYAEMKGAQHAFDIFPSVRSARVIEAVERFLTTLWERRRDDPAESEVVVAEVVAESAAPMDQGAVADGPGRDSRTARP